MKNVALAVGLLVAGLAWGDAVDVSYKGRALMGQGLPTVTVHILEPIAGFKLKLKRSDGKVVEIKGGGRPGQNRELDLPQPEGRFSYAGVLSVNFPNGTTSEMPLEFDTELWGPLHMKLEKGDVDVPKRKVKFTASRPLAKAVVKVLMDTGKYAFDGEVPFSGEAPGTPLEVSWPEAPGRVMRVSITVYDAATFFTGVEISPWQIDIPHEEVNFDSGKFDVRPDEAPKLEKSFTLISDAVVKFGRLAELKLYVVGHTDTVGATAANRTLSVNRARAISAWFRRQGLKIPIYFDGLGEEALAVSTSDEEPEAKNRRAEYIIAIDLPSVERSPVSPRWQRL